MWGVEKGIYVAGGRSKALIGDEFGRKYLEVSGLPAIEHPPNGRMPDTAPKAIAGARTGAPRDTRQASRAIIPPKRTASLQLARCSPRRGGHRSAGRSSPNPRSCGRRRRTPLVLHGLPRGQGLAMLDLECATLHRDTGRDLARPVIGANAHTPSARTVGGGIDPPRRNGLTPWRALFGATWRESALFALPQALIFVLRRGLSSNADTTRSTRCVTWNAAKGIYS